MRLSMPMARDLRDVRLGLFTKRGDGVDGGDPLGEEGVGHQLREFAAPDVGCDDLFFGNPVRIDVHQDLPGLHASIGLA